MSQAITFIDLKNDLPCCECGGEVMEFSVNNEIWNAVMRPNGEHDKEFVCLKCFAQKMAVWIYLKLNKLPPLPDCGKMYRRYEDMSPDGLLGVYIQQDGDAIVVVQPGEEADERQASVEFCAPMSGGGRSKHTLAALKQLALAIEKDNEEGKYPSANPDA